jgi:hypothetical protein
MARGDALTVLTGGHRTGNAERVVCGGSSLPPAVQVTCSCSGSRREAEGRSAETAPGGGTATQRPRGAQVRRVGARGAVSPVAVGRAQTELAHICRQRATLQEYKITRVVFVMSL